MSPAIIRGWGWDIICRSHPVLGRSQDWHPLKKISILIERECHFEMAGCGIIRSCFFNYNKGKKKHRYCRGCRVAINWVKVASCMHLGEKKASRPIQHLAGVGGGLKDWISWQHSYLILKNECQSLAMCSWVSNRIWPLVCLKFVFFLKTCPHLNFENVSFLQMFRSFQMRSVTSDAPEKRANQRIVSRITPEYITQLPI